MAQKWPFSLPFGCSSEPDERQLMPAAVWSATGMADTSFSAGSPEAAYILKIQRMIMIRGGQRAPADLAFGQIREIKAIVDRHALQVRYVAAIGALIGLLDHKRANVFVFLSSLCAILACTLEYCMAEN
eukprot:COSAG06_NODE_33161_length_494_cov_0.906329_2_plen_128_part_01